MKLYNNPLIAPFNTGGYVTAYNTYLFNQCNVPVIEQVQDK